MPSKLFDVLQVPFEAARSAVKQLAALRSDSPASMPPLEARATYGRLGARPAEARLARRLAELVPQ